MDNQSYGPSFNKVMGCPPDIKDEAYLQLHYWLRGIMPFLVALIGIALNIVAIYLMIPREPLKSIFNRSTAQYYPMP